MRIELTWTGESGRYVPGWPATDFALIDHDEAAPAEGEYRRAGDPAATAQALVAGGLYSRRRAARGKAKAGETPSDETQQEEVSA